MMNTIYENYKTGTSLNINEIKFLQVSYEELYMIYKYYYDGFTITYGTDTKTYTNMTLEHATALMMYYYRPTKNGVPIDNLLTQLVGVHDLDYIFKNTPLTMPTYQNSYTLLIDGTGLDIGQTRTSKHYIIALNFVGSDALPNKVSNNFVEFTMVVKKDNGGNNIVNSLDANVIDFDNLFNYLDKTLSFTGSFSTSNVTNVSSTYSFKIETSKLNTTEFDLTSNVEYNTSAYKLNFVALDATQFSSLNSASNKEAKLSELLASTNFASKAGVSGNNATLTGLAKNSTYNIVAYYTEKTGDGTVVLKVSSNVLKIKYDGSNLAVNELVNL